MSQRLFGVETEYGLSIIPVAGATGDTDRATREFVELARKYPHLPGHRSSGIFLGNGGRFYIDCGAHPEMATPECANPWDACRYVLAGEQMLQSIAEEFTRRDRRTAQTLLSKGNVDYGTHATWGCHESYMHHGVDQNTLSRHVIPHLVSRVVVCGAGGFDSHSPGLDFLISPRVAHLQTVVSGESTSARGIFHTRDEPLCGKGFRRMHVLCGESLCGEAGTWLKVGTTALVVALIEAGKHPGGLMALQDPLTAMRTFSADPTCTRTARLINGREATALAIQYHFLDLAEKHAKAAFMPPWAGDVCIRWRATLDRLRQGVSAVARTFDWAIKLTLYENHLRRDHTTLARAAYWTPVLKELSAALEGVEGGGIRLSTAVILARNGPLAPAVKRLTPHLKRNGLRWEELESFMAMRMTLFEIDTRFSLVGDSGLFTVLDRKNLLDHRVCGVDNIQHAIEHPPIVGRAAVRGECIRRLAGHNGRYACEWDAVFDLREKRRCDISDPFCEAEEWVKEPEPDRANRIDELFRRGYYADVLAGLGVSSGPRVDVNLLECEALSHARLGWPTEALAVLEAGRRQFVALHYIGLKLSVFSNGLRPSLEVMAPLIAEGDLLIEQAPDNESYSHFIFYLYKALYQMHSSLVSESEALFARLLSSRIYRGSPRMYCRAQCYYGELLRRRGRAEEAVEIIRAAYQAHRSGHLSGDLAMHSLPMLAKLSTDAEARCLLDEAEAILRVQRNELGLARVLCIRARKLRDGRSRDDFGRLSATLPGLARCPTARRIAERWDEWVNPSIDAGAPDDYWGI